MWGLLTAAILIFCIGIDRTFLVDQGNYLQYFYAAPTLEWIKNLDPRSTPPMGIVIYLVSGEAVWQVWATLLGWILSPATAVVVTVCLLNLLLALAVLRLPDPVLPLLIWIIVPVGLAVTGLLQVRQGFALAVMLYAALRLNRPVAGTLVATLIHTTFAITLPFALVAWLCGRRQTLALMLTILLAVAAAYAGGVLFEAFGGRRLATYAVGETEATSILYVFGALLCSAPSLHRLFAGYPSAEMTVKGRTLALLAIMHLGVIAFSVASFFVFPLGAGRAGYFITLLLIPLLPTIRWRGSVSGSVIFAVMVLFLVYLLVRTSLDDAGIYDIYFAG